MDMIVIAALVLAFAMCVIPGVMACYNYFGNRADATAKAANRRDKVLAHKAV
jgi:hypothetical protein